MRIFRMLFAKKQNRQSRPRFLILAALIGFMVIAQPQPAQAQWIVADPGQYVKEAVEWAKWALQWIATQAEWILNHFLLASGAVGNNIAQMAQTRGTLIGAQAGVDATTRVPYMQQTTQITLDHTMLPGAKWCYLGMEESAIDQMRKAKTALLGALEVSFTEVGAAGNDPTAKLTLLRGWCDSSFLDPAAANMQSGGDMLKSLQCTAPTYPQFVGKDADINSVVGVTEMYMPAKTTQSKVGGGVLVLPKAAAATVKEMPAIAALYYCLNRHMRTATPVLRTGTANVTNATEFVDQRLQKMTANTPSEQCLELVADRMAVGSSATGELQKVYEAQASLCLYMNKTGKLSASENASCQTDGMSWLNAQSHIYCRGGRPDYIIARAAQGSTVNELTGELTRGSTECMNFNREMQSSTAAFVRAMQQADTSKETTEPNPTAR
jgi:hypothetical protein